MADDAAEQRLTCAGGSRAASFKIAGAMGRTGESVCDSRAVRDGGRVQRGSVGECGCRGELGRCRDTVLNLARGAIEGRVLPCTQGSPRPPPHSDARHSPRHRSPPARRAGLHVAAGRGERRRGRVTHRSRLSRGHRNVVATSGLPESPYACHARVSECERQVVVQGIARDSRYRWVRFAEFRLGLLVSDGQEERSNRIIIPSHPRPRRADQTAHHTHHPTGSDHQRPILRRRTRGALGRQ